MAKKTSPWLYVGCGCAALVGLAVVGVIAAGFFGASMFQGYVEDMQDPVARTERVKEILGTSHFPDGYHALMYFKIPWIMDMAILSDGPEVEGGVFDEDFEALSSDLVGEHVFMYFSVRGDASEKDVEEIFGRRRHSGDSELDMGSQFQSSEELARGELEIGPQKLSWVGHRGELETDEGERIAGIYSQIRAVCPDRKRTRLAVWFERLPAGLQGDTPVDLPGTPADAAAVGDFMGHFNLCAK